MIPDNKATQFRLKAAENARGHYCPLQVPRGTHKLDVWEQSVVTVNSHFNGLQQIIELFKICLQSAKAEKASVTVHRGNLPQDNQRRSDDPALALPAADPDLAKRRYAFEIARARLCAARDDLAKAADALDIHIRQEGLSEKQVMPFNQGTTRTLYCHNLALASALVQEGLAEVFDLNAYLSDLPSFEFEVERAFRIATFDHKVMISRVKDEAKRQGCEWQKLALKKNAT